MTSWDDLRIFLAVVRGRSHAAAGRRLGVDATTVGRRLFALERALGARLFTRTPAGLVPGAAGLALLPAAERVEAEVEGASRALAGADARVAGRVRVTAGDGLVTYLLVPTLSTLRERYPELEVELHGDNRAADLTRGEADVAVRLFRPREAALVTRRLGTFTYGLYAGQAYLARRGAPRSTAELPGHDLVTYDASLEGTSAQRWLRQVAPGARRALRTNTTAAMLAACAEGLGLAVLPDAFASRDARLVRLLPRTAAPPREAWAVTHADLHRSARVAAVLRWLGRVVGEVA